MSKQFLVGAAAGIIGVVALLSATTGPAPVQFLFFVLAPLPVFMAGLALGWMAAATAAITAFIIITVLVGPTAGILAAGSQFGPAVLLSYLALLNREATGPDGSVTLQWYPVGRLLMWCAVIGTILTMALLLVLGRDGTELQENLQRILRETIEQAVSQQAPKDGTVPQQHLDQMVELAMALLPVAAGMLMTLIQVVVFYVAARIVMASGYLSRPWPDIAALTFPQGTPLALAGSILLSAVLTGYAGMAASAAAGAFYAIYVLLGLAIVIYVTRGSPWRFFIIWAVCFGLLVFNTLVSLVLALMGLAEPFSPLRRDFMAPPPSGRPPPPDNDS